MRAFLYLALQYPGVPGTLDFNSKVERGAHEIYVRPRGLSFGDGCYGPVKHEYIKKDEEEKALCD